VPTAYGLKECAADTGASATVVPSADGVLDVELRLPETQKVVLTLRF